ncbi:MAG: SPFH domain-containing protein [Armatimonadetes bacterium]|nr:SPFH domain-containing protein [Armatimonadota bacterium]
MDLLDVIEWQDVSGQEIVHRWPPYGPGNVRLGAQLTVRESQAAVFFRDGKAMDVLGVGRHTLTTANIPLLEQLIKIPFGGETPFQAEVYFVNMRTLTGLKWGTAQPIIFRDSELAMVRLRALGAYTCRVQDPQLFVNEVVGTESREDTEGISSWLRDFIIARFNDILGDQLKTILDLPTQYDEIAAAVKTRVGEDFENYGLELIDFLVEAITPPEEVMAMIDQRAGMEAAGDLRKFLQFRTAQAIGEMPQAGGGAGDAASVGVGIGAGVGMGAAMAGAMKDAFAPDARVGASVPDAQASGGTCPEGHPVPAGAKFCPQCGKPVATAAFCPECGKPIPAGAKFCPECGKAV